MHDAKTAQRNHFSLVFLNLPTSFASAIERARETTHRMDHLKRSEDARVAFAVLDAIGRASPALEHVVLDLFTRKATLLTTDVPGPPGPCLWAGTVYVVWRRSDMVLKAYLTLDSLGGRHAGALASRTTMRHCSSAASVHM